MVEKRQEKMEIISGNSISSLTLERNKKDGVFSVGPGSTAEISQFNDSSIQLGLPRLI